MSQKQNSPKSTFGYIHSTESMGTVDGPGLRTVVFFQGCPLKCKFCHNIDCGTKNAGTKITVEDLATKVLKNKPYWDSYEKPYCDVHNHCVKGGVTMSGGDPTFQPIFLREFLKRIKEEGVHTAVDSCLVTERKVISDAIPFVDLWMTSIKHTDSKQHEYLTGVPNEIIHDNLLFLDRSISEMKAKKGKTERDPPKIRIRFLVIPGLTDSEENILKTGKIAKGLKNLESLEILPYGSHGKYKWIELFGKYELEGVPDAGDEDIQRVRKILETLEIPLIYAESSRFPSYTK